MNLSLHAGDIVIVKKAEEIIKTLDANGTLDGLPFIPEMLEFCGKKYRVTNHIVQAVVDGAGLSDYSESYVREFKNDDVVLLENLRCSGVDHDGCQRGCMIFWKEAWLTKVDASIMPETCLPEISKKDYPNFKTQKDEGIYFCQSTEFINSTNHLFFSQRIKKCFVAVQNGNNTIIEMTKILLNWGWWKTFYRLIGIYPKGNLKTTPKLELSLQPGELVEVKSLPEIVDTLDKKGCNRGLHFSTDMRKFCGQQFKVRTRADKLITESTGKMRGIPNTVILENVTSDSSYFAFGGCPRMEFLYWREIWLKRVK